MKAQSAGSARGVAKAKVPRTHVQQCEQARRKAQAAQGWQFSKELAPVNMQQQDRKRLLKTNNKSKKAMQKIGRKEVLFAEIAKKLVNKNKNKNKNKNTKFVKVKNKPFVMEKIAEKEDIFAEEEFNPMPPSTEGDDEGEINDEVEVEVDNEGEDKGEGKVNDEGDEDEGDESEVNDEGDKDMGEDKGEDEDKGEEINDEDATINDEGEINDEGNNEDEGEVDNEGEDKGEDEGEDEGDEDEGDEGEVNGEGDKDMGKDKGEGVDKGTGEGEGESEEDEGFTYGEWNQVMADTWEQEMLKLDPINFNSLEFSYATCAPQKASRFFPAKRFMAVQTMMLHGTTTGKLTKGIKYFMQCEYSNWFCVTKNEFKSHKVTCPYDDGKTLMNVLDLATDPDHIRILPGAEDKDGKLQDGKIVDGGLDSRTSQASNGTKRRIDSVTAEENPSENTTSSLPPGGGESVLSEPVEPSVAGKCVAEVLGLVAGGSFSTLAAWVPIHMVPKIISINRHHLKCGKSFHWFPSESHIFFNEAGDFHAGSIQMLCDLASANFKAIVQVILDDGNHSKHCAAIFDHPIVDPEGSVARPLTVKSFSDLGITKIVTGFMIVPHGRNHFRSKRTKPS